MPLFSIKPSFKTEKGFESIYHQHAQQMLIICHNRISDKEIAKEIVQDIFKSLWERRNELIIKGSIKHYLLRATKFEIIDFYRKQSRKKPHLELVLDEPPFLYSDYYLERELEYKELEDEVKYLIKKLPSRCREVYLLSRHENLSNKDIALKLTISKKTVEAHMTKALRFLETNLKEYYIV